MVLGQVTELTDQHVVLSLPNNLVGYVPITAISDKLTARLEKLAQEEDEEEAGNTDSEDTEDVDLKNMFFLGQYLRAYVTATTEDALANGVAKTKKRIELSIHPKLVNRGIEKSNLVANSMIQASVLSNEDHGLVMDMGLDVQLKGFLSKSELGSQVKHAKVQEGAVFMCLVSGLNPDGRIVKLSADHEKAGNLKKLSILSKAPTIDVFLPGTAVEMLVLDSTPNTITGKVLGLIDATADIIHSGAAGKGDDVSEKYKIGSKVNARIIFTCPDSDPKKIGISLLEHVVSLTPRMSGKPKQKKQPLEILPIASFVEEAKVTKVDPKVGVYFDLGVRDVVGYAHISKLADERVENLSDTTGTYKLDSKHRARVVGYNAIDGLFQVSLESKVLDQPFLRIDDIRVGQVVKGKVHKLFADKSGSTSVLVHLSEGIIALVPEPHLADVHLQHPERKFREGAAVTARVLSVDLEKHHVKLTLKKSLVNSEAEPWTDYSRIAEGATGPGTLVNISRAGAVVQFYGEITAWLPVSEMSEAYIEDATKHFSKGQVVKVRVLSVNHKEDRMLVSCKDPNAVDVDKETLFQSLQLGDIVKGTVIEKALDSATVDLGHGIKGILRVGHLTDGSDKKDKSTFTRIRVGGSLDDLVVLDKHHKSMTVILSNKPSLRKDAQAQKLITKFEDVHKGETVHGFVRGLLPDKVFIEFGGNTYGLLFQSQLPEEMAQAPNFGLRKDQSITARVTHVDSSQARLWLSMKSDVEMEKTSMPEQITSEATVNAVDDNIKSTADLPFGASTTVRIKSVKSDQLNVQVADNIQGRISVAELFNSWDEIEDKKHPLRQFKSNQTIKVKVLGMHDARNHRFLPFSHRQGKVPIFELTAKKEKLKSDADALALHKITVGSTFIAFVNNITDRFVWVNISANVRGRIDLLDLSDDLSLLADIEGNFPVGCALKVHVKAVDVAAGRLDLTATSSPSNKSLGLEDLKEGLVLPARVTKVNDSSIVVQINENIAGPIYLEQLADDYEQAKPSNYKPGDVVRVCVIEVDVPNKRLGLSARPSRVLSSSLPIKDLEIKDRSQLQVHQVLRGFIKRVADNGLFVRLGHNVDAFIHVSHLSDTYIKEWKPAFQVDQLVSGKIIALNESMKSPQMSLKKSIVEGTYKPLLQFSDMEVGQIVTAKVRHVEDYGVFLVVDNSNNVSGLCHKSELADKPVKDVKDLYKEGDIVKAKVLEIKQAKRRVNFGLKYSYIKGEDEEDEENGEDDSVEDSDDEEVDDEELDDEDAEMRSIKSAESDEDMADQDDIDEDDAPQASKATLAAGLSTSGFDWTGGALSFDDQAAVSDQSSDEDATKKKKKHKKAAIKEDRTGDLDAHGPQSVADFERLLLGQPNSAELWVRYMVFQRELNEIEKARQIARRALATMNSREEKERLDVWTALLHLENDFGSDDLLAETFKEASQYNDSREMHERMIKIYIGSGKLDVSSCTPVRNLYSQY
jgi:rRNA biogenesis protein RRP5